MKIVNIKDLAQSAHILRKIGVDSYGIDSMIAKTLNINLLLKNKPCKIANIIKQEMLSIGGDAAVARGSVDCSIEKTDILVMGTVKQIIKLSEKISKQPFGLNGIAKEIEKIIENIERKEFVLKTSRRQIILGEKTLIMGILNVTPDSFSDGGLYCNHKKAIERGLKLIAEGADIIDIGGESTRPGAAFVSAEEELRRVIPVIEALAGQVDVPICIDTSKASVAEKALAAGAEIVNDVSSLHGDKKMAEVVGKEKAALVLMHMRGKPRTMQKADLRYDDLMNEIIVYLSKSAYRALEAGIEKERLVIDPGIGFGKTSEDNYRIINKLSELKTLGLPIMIGTSRKSFIGKITGDEPQARVEGTAATVTAAVLNGCHVVRVHDVAVMKKVAAVTDAIRKF